MALRSLRYDRNRHAPMTARRASARIRHRCGLGAPRRCDFLSLAHQRALTLVELLLAIAILGVLGTLAYNGYQQYIDKARIAQAKVDIRGIEAALERYRAGQGRFPETLAEAGLGAKLDPWKQPYQYLNIETAKNRGQVRKDRNLVPINSDF